MRSFIAISFPPETKTQLSKLQLELKKTSHSVKWVEPENIHLTLKFLGEINSENLEQITPALKSVCLNHIPFYLNISGLGVFPNIKSARVIWVGLTQGDKETQSIASDIETILEPIGFAKESRPFSSHITIGRVKSNQGLEELIKKIEMLNQKKSADFTQISVGKITLFKSTLSPKGPSYGILKEFNLKTT